MTPSDYINLVVAILQLIAVIVAVYAIKNNTAINTKRATMDKTISD